MSESNSKQRIKRVVAAGSDEPSSCIGIGRWRVVNSPKISSS